MISPRTARLIKCLPVSFVKYVSRKLVNKYLKTYANIKVTGLENISNAKRPIIFICNHLSNSDALVLESVLKEENVTFVAGVKLSHSDITSLGVDLVKTTPLKPNTADKEGLTKIINIIKAGGSILIFPEGTRSRTKSMIEGKKGILLIARLTKAVIVPVGISGTEKLMPINDKDMNDEKFNYADVFVNVGKPIEVPVKKIDEDRQNYEERALTYLMKSISVLLPESYRGVYSSVKNDER